MAHTVSVHKVRKSFDGGGSHEQGVRRNETMIVSIPIEDDEDVLCEDSEGKQKKPRRKMQNGAVSLLCIIYAMLICIAGSLLPLTEALRETWMETHANGMFLVLIYTMGTAFIVYLQVYLIPQARKIHLEAEKKRKEQVVSKLRVVKTQTAAQLSRQNNSSTSRFRNRASLTESCQTLSDVMENDGSETFWKPEQLLTAAKTPSGVGDSLTEDQLAVEKAWFNVNEIQELLESEGTSFYVRFGILLFSIGNIIYICLELEYYLFSDVPESCLDDVYGWTFFLRLAFVLVQTFFLLKNAKVVNTQQKNLVKFGFVHLIATNFCVWFRTLLKETWHHLEELRVENGTHFDVGCLPASPMTECHKYRDLLSRASPYLFPFVLEYSLTAAGIFAVMFLEVGQGERSEFIHALKAIVMKSKNPCNTKITGNKKATQRNTVFEFEGSQDEILPNDPVENHYGPMHASSLNRTDGINLEKSNRGMFLGFIFMAGMFVSMLFFYVELNSGDEVNANFIYLIQDLILHCVMLLATIVAMIYLDALPLVFKAISIDDFVLLISLNGALFLEMSELLLAIGVLTSPEDFGQDTTNFIIAAVSPVVASVQSILQSILIIGGLRRYTDAQCLKECEERRNKMPGREYITFLIVTNVTIWIFRSIVVRQVNHDIAFAFYGELAWLFIVNINMPLLLFFRFHSSACCAEIWSSAYKPVSFGFNGFQPLEQAAPSPPDTETQSTLDEEEIKNDFANLNSGFNKFSSIKPFTINEHDEDDTSM